MLSQSNLQVNLPDKEEFSFSKLNVSTRPHFKNKIKMKVSLESPDLKKSLIKGSERFYKMKNQVVCFDQLMKLADIVENEKSVEVFINE